MKRSGFTLIELVFIIVILGILAAIAIPKLSGLQDDATVATEDAGIGAIRTGLQVLKGKVILQPAGFNITLTGSDGTIGTGEVYSNDIEGNAIKLSVSGAISSGANALTTDSENKDGTLSAVLEPGGREQWKTKSVGGTNKTRIAGPASSTITSNDAKYNKNGSWLYTPSANTVVYQPATAY